MINWYLLSDTQRAILIERAQDAITNRCDGPLTAFVLISRACEYSANPEAYPEAFANALDTELTARGFLDSDAGEVEIPGS